MRNGAIRRANALASSVGPRKVIKHDRRSPVNHGRATGAGLRLSIATASREESGHDARVAGAGVEEPRSGRLATAGADLPSLSYGHLLGDSTGPARRGKGDSAARSVCNFLASTRAATCSSSAQSRDNSAFGPRCACREKAEGQRVVGIIALPPRTSGLDRHLSCARSPGASGSQLRLSNVGSRPSQQAFCGAPGAVAASHQGSD